MEKVKLHISHATAMELSDLLGRKLLCPPDAPAAMRLAMFVVDAWRKKKLWPKMLERNPKGYKLTLDTPIAFALKALLDDETADPTTPVGICLLHLFDDIQRVYYAPNFLPAILLPFLPGTAPIALLASSE